MENVTFEYKGYFIIPTFEQAVYLTAKYYNGFKNSFVGNATSILVENGWEFNNNPAWIPPHMEKRYGNIAVLRSRDGETFWYYKSNLTRENVA